MLKAVILHIGKDKFSALAGVIIGLFVIAGIGFGGYYMYSTHYAAKPTSIPASQSFGSNQYKGWKPFTLRYEKLTFQYPPAWTIEDNSKNGFDAVGLIAPDRNFQMSITAGMILSAKPAPPAVLEADKVTFLGRVAYLDYASVRPPVVAIMDLSTSPDDTTPAFVSEHPAYSASNPGGSTGNIAISAAYTNDLSDAEAHQTLQEAQKDPNFIAAKAVIASMHY